MIAARKVSQNRALDVMVFRMIGMFRLNERNRV